MTADQWNELPSKLGTRNSDEQNNQNWANFADGNSFYLLGDFDEDMKWRIILPLTKKIEELSKQKDATIDIYINSYGGYCDIMWHIVQLIELAKKKDIKVRTIVIGSAYSAASMTAITGTPGERYIDPRAEHLPHYGTAGGYRVRTPLQGERTAAHTRRHFKQLVDHYKKYSNIPDLEKHVKDDMYFIPAKSCIKYKLADKFVEEM